MIIEKQQPAADEHPRISVETIPSEPPPSYEATSGTSAIDSRRSFDQKSPYALPIASGSGSRTPTSSTKPSSWLSYFGVPQADKEMQETILKLVRDVVKHDTQPSSVSIIMSCIDACRARGISFESLLQEKSIEGHTPLYWAIVKRPSGVPMDSDMPSIGVIDLLLSFPLTESTRQEARQACLLSSDDELFQRLRRSPGFATISGSDDMLNLGEGAPDLVRVHNESGAKDGDFAVSFHIVDFQRRMRISKKIHLEFIARGRIWSFDFRVYTPTNLYAHNFKPGAWVVSIELLGDSPSTWLNSRVTLGVSNPHDDNPTPAPPITLQVKTGHTQLMSDFHRPKWQHGRGALVVSIEGGLEYTGCPQVRPDGSLLALFEAKLAQTQADCIIC
jgi:hypothetical protein